MATNRRVRSRARRPAAIPWGIYTYLLGLPYDPIADAGTGRLETFRCSRAALLAAYGRLLTPDELRKAKRIAERER